MRVSLTLDVQVTVTGGSPATVSLLVDGAVAAQVASPFHSSVDTSHLAEGSHTLKATATQSGQSVESSAISFVVDHTPPALLSWEPPTRLTNLWLKASVTLKFSEPMMPRSIQEALTCSWAGTPIACDVAETVASASFRVALTLGPAQLPDGELKVTLSKPVADLAGNALAAGPSWSGAFPTWELTGGTQAAGLARRWDHVGPDVALDANGRPVVAYTLGGTSSKIVAVSRFDGAGWNLLGAPIDGDYDSSIALDSQGVPVLATTKCPTTTACELDVWRWDGTTWVQLGASLLRLASASTTRPVVRLTSTGTPIVAWAESDTQVVGYVARWTGLQWELLGGVLNADITQSLVQKSYPLGLVIDSTGAPVVSWREVDTSSVEHVYVRWWQPSMGVWSAPSEPMRPSAGCYPHTLAIGNDRPHIACTWAATPADAWAVLRLESRSAPSWAASEADTFDINTPIGLVVTPDALVLAGYSWTTADRLAFRRQNPTWSPPTPTRFVSWQPLGGDITAEQTTAPARTQGSGHFVIGPDGTMALVFETDDTSTYRVWVKRFNRY